MFRNFFHVLLYTIFHYIYSKSNIVSPQVILSDSRGYLGMIFWAIQLSSFVQSFIRYGQQSKLIVFHFWKSILCQVTTRIVNVPPVKHKTCQLVDISIFSQLCRLGKRIVFPHTASTLIIPQIWHDADCVYPVYYKSILMGCSVAKLKQELSQQELGYKQSCKATLLSKWGQKCNFHTTNAIKFSIHLKLKNTCMHKEKIQ